ncbi:PQQ-dependent sugar dehydrogenase [Halococcus dombrowskii]|uniref:PQQ-dependent sugar dehydrogenase n=1 Tax=Halococcus dombrowskii TaxID=179637 RepID=A0AAV3SK77_HALDO|nr:PQQ-dependent sugar dehydrogenase [Halococcus dombrowskii]UOO94243.1 PQQ-dependent sugar dehydrogenase [Halococcus dombrowskii]
MTKGTNGETSIPSGRPSRRRFLAATAAGVTGLAGAGSITGARAQSQPETIRLGGETTGWVGRKPSGIQGTTNPTLELDIGTTYRLTWKNVDGAQHNVALLDADDAVIERTQYMSDEGKTQTLEFTATEAMDEYVCQAHLNSMRGDITLSSESGTTETTTAESSEPEGFFPTGPTVRTDTVIDGGITAPLGLEAPPGERDAFFIVDQIGVIRRYGADGSGGDVFLDVRDQLIDFDNLPEIKTIDERGLLGLAFHPNFADNRKFYVHFSAKSRPGTPGNYTHTQVIAEFEANEDVTGVVADSQRTVLEIPSPYYTHNGGAIVFGPDDYLYIGIGNGGGALKSSKQPDDWYGANLGGNGQDVTQNLMGSILRIDVDGRDGDKAYGIPGDNPLVGKEGLDEHYAWGFRNPWRIGFSDGRLMAADVGQRRYEEVNVVRKGGNYGWNVREGGHCFVATQGSDPYRANCPTKTPSNVRGGEPLIDPVIEYPHTYETNGVGVAVIGGYIYQNATIPGLRNKYVFGDYSKDGTPRGSLFAATPVEGDSWSVEEISIGNGENGELGAYLLCVARDNDGELYALTTDNLGVEGETGAVHRLRPPEAEERSTATTETPARPATATATPEPTPTPTATATATPTETTNESDTARTGESGGIVSGDGPGFGILAGLAAIALGVARLLGGDDR